MCGKGTGWALAPCVDTSYVVAQSKHIPKSPLCGQLKLLAFSPSFISPAVTALVRASVGKQI